MIKQTQYFHITEYNAIPKVSTDEVDLPYFYSVTYGTTVYSIPMFETVLYWKIKY